MSATPDGAALAVVGGGPAGIAAAAEAAGAGLPVLLLDEAPAPGGQIYRSPPEAFRVRDPGLLGRDHRRGEALRASLARVADRVTVLPGTAVLGIWPGDGNRTLLCLDADGRSREVRARRLILATGAYDRPVPFPGWTLPGVMTAGGVQVLLKTMRVRPGNRALVAGTGPLLLVVASQLRAAGVEVVAVLEAGRPRFTPANLLRVWGEWGLLKDAWDYGRGLRRAGIPLRFHHTVFAAHGTTEVEGATWGPVDPRDWTPLRDRARRAEVDLVVSGFGFVPNTELSVLAGCRHEYAEEVGGWIPVRDGDMRTTAPGVFAAGDGAGVAGVLVAVEEGRVAGLAAAAEAGAIPAAEAARRSRGPRRRLRSLARVRRVLDEMSRIRPGLLGLATPDTLVCRCEEVPLSRVREAVAEGARDLQAVKLLTRLGMGPCQGRNCAPPAAMALCAASGGAPESAGRVNPRPPVKPVTLGALARDAGPLPAPGPGGSGA